MAGHGIPLDLAARLNAIRRRHQWSVRHVADRCDISPDHAHQLLTGKLSPTSEIAERLIVALELDTDTAEALRTLRTSHYVAAYGSTAIRLTHNEVPADEHSPGSEPDQTG